MILNKDFGSKYLEDFKEGRIPLGLGLNISHVDKFLSFKQPQFNIMVGLDNVGKTDFALWYFLCMALLHEKKTVIWSGENRPEQQKRKLMQMYLGRSIKNVDYKEMQKAKMIIENFFDWVDVEQIYNHTELLNIFADAQGDINLIDPYNGLNHNHKVNQFDRNYKFSNDVREFCMKEKKTLFLNAHVVSEASRTRYPMEHPLNGYNKPPIKSHIEGGQPFANRADDFWIIHRLTNHPSLKYFTQLEIVKVKDTETGGSPTMKDEPLCFEYNNGNGFVFKDIDILNPATINSTGFDPLEHERPSRVKQPTKEEIQTAIKQPTPEKTDESLEMFDHTEEWE